MHIAPGFTSVAPYFIVDGAADFLAFLVHGLGGVELGRTTGAEGRIANAQVRLGTASVMLSDANARCPAMKASYYLYVEDAEAAMAKALAHGARLEMAVADMPYGDRQGGVIDAWGNIWWISQRLVPEPYYL